VIRFILRSRRRPSAQRPLTGAFDRAPDDRLWPNRDLGSTIMLDAQPAGLVAVLADERCWYASHVDNAVVASAAKGLGLVRG
jgi:hypothetical protein